MNDTERLNQSIKELNSQIEKTIQNEVSKDNKQKEKFINDLSDKLKQSLVRQIEVNEKKLCGKIQTVKAMTFIALLISIISFMLMIKIYFYIT